MINANTGSCNVYIAISLKESSRAFQKLKICSNKEHGNKHSFQHTFNLYEKCLQREVKRAGEIFSVSDDLNNLLLRPI